MKWPKNVNPKQNETLREQKKTKKETKKKTEKPLFNKYSILSFVIYTITNMETKKYYIGYSTTGDERKDNHNSRLQSGIHACKELQDDFDSMVFRKLNTDLMLVFNVTKSLFLQGTYSTSFIQQVKREFFDMEQAMIREVLGRGDNLYNRNLKESPPKIDAVSRFSKVDDDSIEDDQSLNIPIPTKSCIINGVWYDDLTEASKKEGKTIEFILACINSENYPEYKYSTVPNQTPKIWTENIPWPLMYDGVTYTSISYCKLKTGDHYDTITMKCNSDLKEFDDCKFLSPEKVRQNSNFWAKIPIIIDEQEFSSLKAASVYFEKKGENPSIRWIKRNLDDPKYPTWRYND